MFRKCLSLYVFYNSEISTQNFDISGMYNKHIMIVNDDSSITSKCGEKLIDDARVIIYDRNLFIIQATGIAFFLVCTS
jgi:hypothetical protein